MPAYNAERHIAAAVESILQQSFADFELLVLDDGSTDRTAEIVVGFQDPRIRYHRNAQNLKLAATLNHGLDIARGDLVARMDADDLAQPQRLAIQLDYMDRHPDVDLVGSGMTRFGSTERRGLSVRPVTDANLLRWRQLFANQISHPTVMFRRAALDRLGLRYGVVPDWARPVHRAVPVISHLSEDYLLFGLLCLRGRVENLPEALLRYRVHAQSVSTAQAEQQLVVARQVSRVLFEYLLGEEVSDDAVALCYFTRPQAASPLLVEKACDLIDRAAAAILHRYAVSEASRRNILRDAQLRRGVLQRSSMALQAVGQFLRQPLWPRDAEEWRLAVRLALGEGAVDMLKFMQARLLKWRPSSSRGI